MGILGLMLFFFSFEEIPLLGARFWYLIWALGVGVWVALIVRYVVKVIPAERAAILARQEKKNICPNPVVDMDDRRELGNLGEGMALDF